MATHHEGLQHVDLQFGTVILLGSGSSGFDALGDFVDLRPACQNILGQVSAIATDLISHMSRSKGFSLRHLLADTTSKTVEISLDVGSEIAHSESSAGGLASFLPN